MTETTTVGSAVPERLRRGALGRPDRAERAAREAGFDRIVSDLLAGDEGAFRLAYRSINPGLTRYLGVLVGATDAEDVASETWGQVCRDLASFRGDGDGFRGWVTTIGRHRALDHLRAQGRRPRAGSSDADLRQTAAPDQVEAEALTSISTRAALDLIASLPPEQAEAVLLRTVVGLDAKSAGKVLGKRAGAVRTAAYRGLRTLEATLTTAGADAAGDTFRAAVAEGPT